MLKSKIYNSNLLLTWVEAYAVTVFHSQECFIIHAAKKIKIKNKKNKKKKKKNADVFL